MTTLLCCTVLFPFLAAAVLSCTKGKPVVMYTAAAVEILTGLTLSAIWFSGGCENLMFFVETELIDLAMLAGEAFLMCVVLWHCLRHKRYLIALLSVVQTAAVGWMELCTAAPHTMPHLVLDRLSILMLLVVTVIGSLICLYAVGYMRRYHIHHSEVTNRSAAFFALLFAFLGAMCGLVVSRNLNWMYFFWEITSVISFLLIGYTRTEEAVRNSFRALWMNLLGGAGFCGAIVYARLVLGTADLFELVAMDASVVALPVILLALAGLTKSAQLPFSTWLLGAMVAPTPSSALLHSATMVKAGVYLLIRISPAMHGQISGVMVAYIGGITFFAASLLAISQRDAKKVLAYSTVSNLGLITACAGIGREDTACAAVLLILFHAISKSMLFQCVGAVENATGNRDIEWMRGLAVRLPKLAAILIIGVCGMYLAPFGMLVAKWAALKSFVDSGYVLLVLVIAFGSATTMFYWSKWLCKILAIQGCTRERDNTRKMQYVSMFIHASLVILLCVFLYPVMTGYIRPMITELFHTSTLLLGSSELVVMTVALVLILFLPALLYLLTRGIRKRQIGTYMSGANTGDDRSFVNSMGEMQQLVLSNWYLEGFCSEKKLRLPAQLIAAAAIVLCLCLTGGAL